jgi:hypothetical protein
MEIEALSDGEPHQPVLRSAAARGIGFGVDFAQAAIQAFKVCLGGLVGMMEFWKWPKFWIGAVVILWLAYVIYANSQLAPVEIRIIPWFVTLQLRVAAVIVGGAILGSILTLAIQFLWRRRGSSKNGSAAAPAEPASSSTVA